MSCPVRRARSHSLLLWPLALYAPISLAQEPDSYRETVVVSGTYREAGDRRLPFAIDQIRVAENQTGQPGINLSEALALTPGVTIRERQNYAQDLQISVRGFGARAAFGIRGIKLLIDGIPAATPDGQGQAATFNLDVADRIEVLRGPTAALYGTNAGGVIQMFTRSGTAAPSLSVYQGAGSDGLDKWQVDAEGGTQQLGGLLNISSLQSDGYRDHSAVRRNQIFGKLNATPDSDNLFALSYTALEQDDTEDPMGQTWDGFRADPRSVVANARLFNTHKSIDHQQLGLNYQHSGDNQTIQLNTYAGTRSVEQFQSTPRTAAANVTGDGGVVVFDRTFAGIDLRQSLDFPDIGDAFHVAWGISYDYSSDDRQGYQNFNGTTLGVRGALRRDERDTVSTVQPYVQADWSTGPWLLAAGLRHNTTTIDVDDDYLSNGDDGGHRTDRATTGSVGLSYAPTTQSSFYVNAGRGVENPTFGEMSYKAPPARGFNENLDPSSSTQYEAGLKLALQPAARINLAVFDIETRREIVVDTSADGRTSYKNAGTTQRRGVELGAHLDHGRFFHTDIAYTHLDAYYADAFAANGRIIASGNRLPGIPMRSLTGRFAWTPTETVTTAFEVTHNSAVEAEDQNLAQAAPAYTTCNWYVQGKQQFGSWRTTQTLRVNNLFDQEYVGSVIVNDANARYYEAAPGRNWYAQLGVTYTFD